MSDNRQPFKVGIIGCGHMGAGIARKLSTRQQVFLSSRDREKTKLLAEEIGAKAVEHLEELVNKTDMIILAVKPQNLMEVADLLQGKLREAQSLISILAGTSVDKLKQTFKANSVVRMMPNLALLYGEGVIGLAGEDSPETKRNLASIFGCLGHLHWMSEEKLDALASLTASGQAFVYVLIEAMVEAGIAMGFPAEEALALILEMMKGSITQLRESRKHPAELKWQVASPGGTTIEGLKALERGGVRAAILEAFLATYDKGKKLS
jgi:pyrroline-5-carboxylate reductase